MSRAPEPDRRAFKLRPAFSSPVSGTGVAPQWRFVRDDLNAVPLNSYVIHEKRDAVHLIAVDEDRLRLYFGICLPARGGVPFCYFS